MFPIPIEFIGHKNKIGVATRFYKIVLDYKQPDLKMTYNLYRCDFSRNTGHRDYGAGDWREDEQEEEVMKGGLDIDGRKWFYLSRLIRLVNQYS
jgi:hypothetical protein